MDNQPIRKSGKNAGIDFYSQNQYKNSAISLVAADRDFIKYEPPVFPDYFTKTATGFVYTNGTKQNKIDISLTGYTSVNFLEKPAARNTIKIVLTDNVPELIQCAISRRLPQAVYQTYL